MTPVRTIPMTGRALTYDGTNTADVEAFAGYHYKGTDTDGRPVVRNDDASEATLEPGWVIAWWDAKDGGAFSVHSPIAAARLLEAA